MWPPQLPNELMLEIVSHLLDQAESESSAWVTRDTVKPPFSSVRSCSLASKSLRGLALAAWFRVLVLKDASDVAYCHETFPQILDQWTREVYCVYVDKATVHDLSSFKRATKLYLDFEPEPHIWTRVAPFSHPPSSINELQIVGHAWLTPMNLCLFVSHLPNLRSLRLQLKRVWCHLCNVCTKVQFSGLVPDKVVYPAGLGLPIHYANALISCADLLNVIIAVEYTCDGSTSIGCTGDADQDNPNLWAGECDSCMNLMYKVADFREKWVASKKGLGYAPPPALETVEWQFHSVVETSSTASHVSTSDGGGVDSDGTANSSEI